MKNWNLAGYFLAAAATIYAPYALGDGWRYSSSEDAMRGTTERAAELTSDNSVSLAFPYQGGSSLYILLRHSQRFGGLNAMLRISKGQLLCRIRGCKIAAKFDDGKVLTLNARPAESGHPDFVFLNDASAFVTRLRSAKKVIIEVEVWKHGLAQFTFQAGGLSWK